MKPRLSIVGSKVRTQGKIKTRFWDMLCRVVVVAVVVVVAAAGGVVVVVVVVVVSSCILKPGTNLGSEACKP